MQPTYERCLEEAAIPAVVRLGGGAATRSAVAEALRAYRRIGQAANAIAMRTRIKWITGHLFKS